MAAFERRGALILVFLLLACVPGRAFSSEDGKAPAAMVLPPTIQVDALLESVIAGMLEKSPTFRAQCRAIGEARILVAVQLVPVARNSRTHATSTLRRYKSGLMVAQVEVPAATALSPLIAHEFEHIVEFVEHVDLNTLAASQPAVAVRRSDGTFETERAAAAGRAVQAEMSGR